MKRFVITLFALCLLTSGFAQNYYWTVYNLNVKNGSDAAVMGAIDKFMNSETGKAMPLAVVSGKLFGDSDANYTHQITFLTDDKAVFGKMYSGVLQQSADFQLLGASLDPISKSTGSYLGKSVDVSSAGSGNYQTLVSLSVSDPVTYLAEFKKFAAGIKTQMGDKVGISLQRVLSGNEGGANFVAVIDAVDFETLLGFSETIYESDLFRNFNMKVKDIRKTVSNGSRIILARYNVPE